MKNLKVVSVDDSLINLIIIEEIAKEMGIVVQSFQDPLEALVFIRHNRVDLMFVDYMMPQMNGIELIGRAVALQDELIPIMVTAVDDDQILKLEALKAGAVDFLTKPVDVAQLEEKIKNFTNKSS